jgi:curved DNA-binding protein CbpA
MSRFKEYIVEMSMDFKKAIKILDIDDDIVADKVALKKVYRKIVMQHHPDHGGDEETFKQVDAAYKFLSTAKGTGGSISKGKEHDRKSREMAEAIKAALLSDFQPEIYQNYFNKHSGYTFFYEITKTHQQWPGFEVEFFTKDRKTVFHLKVSASITDIMRGGLTAGGDVSYTVYTEAHGFHMNKKQKMSKSDWGFTQDHSFLKQPEKLFPPKKMKAIFSGKTSKRKFMKRDMIAFLKSKLGADWDGEWVKIPLGEDYWLTLFRSTFMRKGTWNVNGIYQKRGKYGSSRVAQPRFCSFMEEEQTAEILEKIQKEAKKAKGEAIVKKTERLLSQAYEAYKKSKGM